MERSGVGKVCKFAFDNYYKPDVIMLDKLQIFFFVLLSIKLKSE